MQGGRRSPQVNTAALGLALAVAMAAALLTGCASGPRAGRDGPEARPPTGLDQVPDAVPRVEPLRTGGPNKPYRVLGRGYTPLTDDLPLQEDGLASWYGRKFHGQPTSNGEIYDMYAMTAAHKTMPLPSYARVRNPANGREIVVRVNDRGPFADGRVIDLSYTAALRLGVLAGVAPVQVQRLTFDDIRNGRWRDAARGPGADRVASILAGGVAGTATVNAPVPATVNAVANVLADDGAVSLGAGPGATAGFWLQLGAFRQREGAQLLQQQVLNMPAASVDAIAVFEEEGLFRVQAGPYATRAQAQQVAERLLRHTGRSALVLERTAP